MSGDQVWRVLGIEPTQERAEIRRAYARKLKITNPEDDADGFQALRLAYEQALAGVDQLNSYPFGAAERVEELTAASYGGPETTIDRVGQDFGRGALSFQDELTADLQSEQEAHSALCRRLESMLTDETLDVDGANATIEAIYRSPAMISVDVLDRTEAWLAQLLLAHVPRSDTLIGPALRLFRWDQERVGGAYHAGQGVAARSDDLLFLKQLRQAHSTHHEAYIALTRRPHSLQLLLNLTTPWLAGKVERLLRTIRWERHSLVSDLNQEALDWWDRRLEKPQFGAFSVWTLAFAPLLALPFIYRTGVFGTSPALALPVSWAGALVIVGGLLGLKLMVARIKCMWRDDWSWRTPTWVQAAWAPLAMALPAFALLTPSSLWIVGAITGLAMILKIWAEAVAEADGVDSGLWAQARRALPSYLPLICVVIFVGEQLRTTAEAFQAGAGVAAAVVIFAAGGPVLANLWRGLAYGRRVQLLLTLGILTAFTPLLLWLAGSWPPLVAVGLTLITVFEIVRRTVLHSPTGAWLAISRLAVFPGVFIVWLIWFSTDEVGQGASALLFGGTWLMVGVAIAVVSTLRDERRLAPRTA